MAHTFDTKYQGARANTAPYTFNYTCGAGTTVLVLSIVVGGTTARAGGAPTYNAVALTQADQNRQSTETFAELWFLLNPPTGSSLQVSIPNTGTAKYLSPVASSYKAQTGWRSALRTANGSTGTSTNPTGPTLTGLAIGDVIIAVVGSGANTWAPTARTGTQLYDRDDGTYGNGAQYLIKTDANNTAMSWTFGTSDDWAICEAAFREVAFLTVQESQKIFDSQNIRAFFTKTAQEFIKNWDSVTATKPIAPQIQQIQEYLKNFDSQIFASVFIMSITEYLKAFELLEFELPQYSEIIAICRRRVG